MAYAVVGARPNSHPFQERHISLKEAAKIGRSVAKAKPTTSNLIFDCKVLSRNHAILWYENGKFFLQDTKSSNGTYVNNVQLGRSGDESDPQEVKSGDIVQFGVDVVENSRKVTHGCIIATVTLFHPDGREASGTPDDVAGGLLPLMNIENTIQAHEFWQLSQYLQDARHREQMLEQKLATLQRMIANSQAASDETWQLQIWRREIVTLYELTHRKRDLYFFQIPFKAFIKEDRLLSRLDIVENQIEFLTKDMTEEDIRHEILNLCDDKQTYETSAKETLRKVIQEKIDALQKLTDVERTLSNSEDECTHLRNVYEKSQDELKDLMEKHRQRLNEMQQLQDQVLASEKRHQTLEEEAKKEKSELKDRLVDAEKRGSMLAVKVESLQAECDFTKEQLSAIKEKLEKRNGELKEPVDSDEDDPFGTQKRVKKPKEPPPEENDILTIDAEIAGKSPDSLELNDRIKDTPRELKETKKDISRLNLSAQDVPRLNGEVSGTDGLKDLSEESCDVLGRQLGLFSQLQEHLLDMKDSVLDALEALVKKIGGDECDFVSPLNSSSNNAMSPVIPISTSLEEQVHYYQKALENSCKQAKFLRDELVRVAELAERPLNDQEKNLQDKLRQMTEKYESKQEEVETLNEELSETQSEVREVKVQIMQLQDQLFEEQDARRSHEAIAATLETKLREEESKGQEYEEALSFSFIKLQEEELKSQEYEETVSCLSKRLQELNKHLEFEKMEKEHEHQSVESARSAAAKMQKQAADKAREAGKGKVELSAMSDEVEMLRMKIQLLNSEIKKLKQENSWLSSEKVRLTDELSSLKQKSFERHEKLKSHQESLTTEIETVKRKRSSSLSEVFSLEEELQLAHKQIDDLQERSRKEIVSINEQKSTLIQLLLVLIVVFIAIGAAYLLDVINISPGNSPIFDPMTWTEIYHNLF